MTLRHVESVLRVAKAHFRHAFWDFCFAYDDFFDDLGCHRNGCMSHRHTECFHHDAEMTLRHGEDDFCDAESDHSNGDCGVEYADLSHFNDSRSFA